MARISSFDVSASEATSRSAGKVESKAPSETRQIVAVPSALPLTINEESEENTSAEIRSECPSNNCKSVRRRLATHEQRSRPNQRRRFAHRERSRLPEAYNRKSEDIFDWSTKTSAPGSSRWCCIGGPVLRMWRRRSCYHRRVPRLRLADRRREDRKLVWVDPDHREAPQRDDSSRRSLPGPRGRQKRELRDNTELAGPVLFPGYSFIQLVCASRTKTSTTLVSSPEAATAAGRAN